MKTNNKAFIELFLIMCLCWQFLCYHVVISGDGCIEIERNALLSFKEDFDDNYSGIFSSWKVGADDCCKWKGVECHVKTGRVISLNLRDQGVEIRGKLNSSLVNLKDLRYLDLSQNNFNEIPIPSFIGSFERLRYLNLSYSSFGGEVPSQLGNLSNLVYLDLHNNYMEGNDLSWISGLSYLKHLDLSEINLSLDSNHWLETINTTLPYLVELHLYGCSLTVEKLPKSLGNLCSLRELILSHNDIGGDIGELMDGFSTCNTSNLKYLDLEGNHIVGDIPKSIGNLTSLEYFSVWDNQLNGPIPESLGKLSSLSVLVVSYYPWNYSNSAIIITERHLYNLSSLTKLQIRGSRHTNNLVFDVSPDWVPPFKLELLFIESCGLGPDFPAWLRNQYKLKSLYLRNAMLSGAIPHWFPNLSLSLYVLDLSDNMFSGTIPHNIDQLMPMLTRYSVSNNHLYGSIPSSIGNLSTLFSLELDHNSLVGEIPGSMGNLSSLSYLSLEQNNLVGEIPSWMGNLSSLLLLSLRNNNLSGQIPHSLQNCGNMRLLDLADNMFYGEISSWIGETMPNLLVLQLRSNRFIGHIPKQLCTFPSLHFLDLAHNHLSGTIPFCLGNMTALKIDQSQYGNLVLEDVKVHTKGTEFTYKSTIKFVNLIDLSVNNLTGEIPKAITNLSILWSLNLSMNHLTGRIPDEIGSLNMLETLDLSFNRLSGTLPPSLAYMTLLNHLNLSYNDFEGRIPTGNQLQTLLDPSIYMNNPGLCGTLLALECSDDVNNRKKTDPIIIVDEDNKDELRWFLVSMGFGFAVGFWGFVGTLVMKQSWRRAYFGFVEDRLEAVMISVIRFRIKLMKPNRK